MALADNILDEWQLQPQLLCGQAYDCAGAKAGKFMVLLPVSTLSILKLYTHCASNRLNLCVMRCCSIHEVSNMMQTAHKILHFFNNSPKRQVLLEKWIESTPEENRKKLKELCQTRWVKRHEAFEVFSDLFLLIALRLLSTVHHLPGIGRHIRMLSHFYWLCRNWLSVKLQGRYTDVVRVHQEIETVKATIKGVRSRVDTFPHKYTNRSSC
jgi:hypothetical protein